MSNCRRCSFLRQECKCEVPETPERIKELNEKAIRIYLDQAIEKLDCGDSSCYFKKCGGMRTNGGCRCKGRLETDRDLQRIAINLIRLLKAKYDNET